MIDQFYEDKNDDLKERLFLEFNSLSVVYQKPSEKYLKDNVLKHAIATEKKYYSKGRWAKKVNERKVPEVEEDREVSNDKTEEREVE